MNIIRGEVEMHLALSSFVEKRYMALGKRNRLVGSGRIRVASLAFLFLLLLAGSIALVYAQTYVFTLKWGTQGSGDGQMNKPYGVALDDSGNVYVVNNFNDRVQKFSSSGVYLNKLGTSGSEDGQFKSPYGVAVDDSGNIYVTDTLNCRVQKFNSSGDYQAKWGTQGSGNGQFYNPWGIAVDNSGYVYVADTFNNRVQKFSSSGDYQAKWGSYGSGDGQFDRPCGVAVDDPGNVYVTDAGNERVQKFATSTLSPTPTPTPTPTSIPQTPSPSASSNPSEVITNQPTKSPKPDQTDAFPTILLLAGIIAVIIVVVSIAVYIKRRTSKRSVILSAITVLLLLSILIAANFLTQPSPQEPKDSEKPFYFGVSFGGKTVSEAKALIDRVKNFTNYFGLASGQIAHANTSALYEIGDYAVSQGLSFTVFADTDDSGSETTRMLSNQGISITAFQYRAWVESWIDNATQRWGDKFLGIYYGDELGGKTLDTGGNLSEPGIDANVTIGRNGVISLSYANGTNTLYNPNGYIYLSVPLPSTGPQKGLLTLYYSNGTLETIRDVPKPSQDTLPAGTRMMWIPNRPDTLSVIYYPNGTVQAQTPGNIRYTAENGSDVLSQYEPYSSILEKKPIKTFDDMAHLFVDFSQNNLEWLKSKNVTVFTSDYALHWWDYLSGYDVVLAQLGWNNTVSQEIALVRGAANMHNRSWGTIITWTYGQEPYLASGDTIYDQMRQSYECGAQYVVVFNYANDMKGTYGILQDEHLEAMERFWTEVVQNPELVHGEVEAEALLVLPHDYGWGLRKSDDVIWGVWKPDDLSGQVWKALQDNLARYGQRLDIVYDDARFPVEAKYSQVHYWNQTG
jgi:hypothetical protein